MEASFTPSHCFTARPAATPPAPAAQHLVALMPEGPDNNNDKMNYLPHLQVHLLVAPTNTL